MAGPAVALNRSQLGVISNGGRWLASWHGPDDEPQGRPHGATGICRVLSGEVVLISEDGERWGFPGGRPEGPETWRETLERELEEEACAGVLHARLLGWGRGECLSGPEEGLVIIRSNWAVTVELGDWRPRFEVKHRRLCVPGQVYRQVHMDPGMEPLVRRQLKEAGLPYGG